MPAPLAIVLFGTTFATFLTSVLLPLAWILLRALGIGAITYVGLDLIESQIVSYIDNSMTDIKNSSFAGVYQFAGLLNIDVLINSVISGFTTRLTIRLLCGGKMRQLKLFHTPC